MDTVKRYAHRIASSISSDAMEKTEKALTKDAHAIYREISTRCMKAKRDAQDVYNVGIRTVSENEEAYKTYMSIRDANDAVIDTAKTEYERACHDAYDQVNEAGVKAYNLVYETAERVFASIYCPADGAYEALYDKWDTLRFRYPHTGELDDAEDAMNAALKAVDVAKDKAYKAAFDAATYLYNTATD
jgi:hypothetical protein